MTVVDAPAPACCRCGESPEAGLPAYGKGRCRACLADMQRAWRALQNGRINERQRVRQRSEEFRAQRRKVRNPSDERRRQLLLRYGLDQAGYDAILAAQHGTCAICEALPDGRLYVDHCHESGRVRGLLCCQCNFALGHLRDDPALLLRAADYLTSSKGV